MAAASLTNTWLAGSKDMSGSHPIYSPGFFHLVIQNRLQYLVEGPKMYMKLASQHRYTFNEMTDPGSNETAFVTDIIFVQVNFRIVCFIQTRNLLK